MRTVRTRCSAVLIAASVALGATGCDSNVGAAATVDGSRIAEADVAKYVNTTGSDANTRTGILALLVKQKLYERALSRLGVSLTEPELTALQSKSVQALSGVQVPDGQAAVDAEAAQLPKQGVTGALAPILFRAFELEYAFAVAVKAKDIAGVVAAAAAMKMRVTVSPRYGTWEADKQEIGQAVAPSFLTMSPAPAPVAGP